MEGNLFLWGRNLTSNGTKLKRNSVREFKFHPLQYIQMTQFVSLHRLYCWSLQGPILALPRKERTISGKHQRMLDLFFHSNSIVSNYINYFSLKFIPFFFIQFLFPFIYFHFLCVKAIYMNIYIYIYAYLCVYKFISVYLHINKIFVGSPQGLISWISENVHSVTFSVWNRRLCICPHI